MSETELVRATVRLVNLRIRPGGCVWRNNTGARVDTHKGRKRFHRYGKVGSPDVLGYAPDGRLIGIECKIGRNEPTDLQREFLEHAIAAGCVIGVAHDLEDVQDILEGHGL